MVECFPGGISGAGDVKVGTKTLSGFCLFKKKSTLNPDA